MRTFVILVLFLGLMLNVGHVSGDVGNVQPITVDSGLTNEYVNGAFTSVTVCVPGSDSECQTISDVVLDTGSVGLRILSAGLSLSLPQQTGAMGDPVAECLPFVSGYTWGPVQLADVKIAGEQANSVPIQVIGDPTFSVVPTQCINFGLPPMNTLQTLMANGILGVGLFRHDCGNACTVSGPSNPGLYYECSSSDCQQTVQSLSDQVQNPVALFSSDNNGVVIVLPSVSPTGFTSVTGSLIFGIGTQTNNGLGAATVLTTDASGNFTTIYKGQSYSSSFIESGSNGIFFLDPATTGIGVCSGATGWYCPPSTQYLSATNRGANGASGNVNFSVANADSLFANPAYFVFGNLAGPNPGSFDWGLPFFLGRTVFTAIESQETPAGPGPYWAYDSEAVLVSVAVTPVNPSIAQGTARQFTATGAFADGTEQDLTTAVTWTSSDVGVATISNTGVSSGLATAVATGSTTVTATLGSISGSSTLTVTSPWVQASVLTAVFNEYGTYNYLNNTWTQITPVAASLLAAGDFDGDGTEDVAAVFKGYGTYTYINGVWTQLTAVEADFITTGDFNADGYDDIVASFPGYGTYTYVNNVWTQLTPVEADFIATGDFNGDGYDDITASFTGYGTYTYINDVWAQITPVKADVIATGDFNGDGYDEIVGVFAGYGTYTYINNAWAQLTPVQANLLGVGDLDNDGKDDIVASFAGYGTYTYIDNVWTQITPVKADLIEIGDFNSDGKDEIVAAFTGYGIYEYMNNSLTYSVNNSWNYVLGVMPSAFIGSPWFYTFRIDWVELLDMNNNDAPIGSQCTPPIENIKFRFQLEVGWPFSMEHGTVGWALSRDGTPIARRDGVAYTGSYSGTYVVDSYRDMGQTIDILTPGKYVLDVWASTSYHWSTPRKDKSRAILIARCADRQIWNTASNSCFLDIRGNYYCSIYGAVHWWSTECDDARCIDNGTVFVQQEFSHDPAGIYLAFSGQETCNGTLYQNINVGARGILSNNRNLTFALDDGNSLGCSGSVPTVVTLEPQGFDLALDGTSGSGYVNCQDCGQGSVQSVTFYCTYW